MLHCDKSKYKEVSDVFGGGGKKLNSCCARYLKHKKWNPLANSWKIVVKSVLIKINPTSSFSAEFASCSKSSENYNIAQKSTKFKPFLFIRDENWFSNKFHFISVINYEWYAHDAEEDFPLLATQLNVRGLWFE